MTLIDLHLAILSVTAIVIVYTDHLGLLYILGKKPTLNPHTIRTLHLLVWLGLIGMVITGVLLAGPMWEYMITQSAFLLKMFFVLVLIVNGLYIGTMIPVAGERSFSALTKKERMLLLVSGTLSGVGWIGSAGIGFFFL